MKNKKKKEKNVQKEDIDNEQIHTDNDVLKKRVEITTSNKRYEKSFIKKENEKKSQTDLAILNKYNEILLTETRTINLLNIPNLLYDTEEEKKKVEKKNEQYKKLLNSSENNYRSILMQTLNVYKKDKDVYVSTINRQNKEAQTNRYQLYKLSLIRSTPISELLHKKFLKYRNKKLKRIMESVEDSLQINEKVILNKNQWVQVVGKSSADSKHTTIIPRSFYKSKKNATSLIGNLFATKNLTRTVSNKSRTLRTKSRYKNIKTLKFLANSYSEDEYMIKSMIKKKKDETDMLEDITTNETTSKLPWKINNKKKVINQEHFIELIKNIEKCIVQNIYFLEQMIYKGINVSNFKNNKNNEVKMFDGENYDALTNPNITYNKIKVSFRIRLKNNIKQTINFGFRKVKKELKREEMKKTKPTTKTEETKKTEKTEEKKETEKEIQEKNRKDIYTITKNDKEEDNTDVYMLEVKQQLQNIPKKKKRKMKKKMSLLKLKKNMAKKVAKKIAKIEKHKEKEEEMNGAIQNVEPIKKEHLETIQEGKIKNKQTSEDVKLKNTSTVDQQVDQIGDILFNEKNNEKKLQRINTLIVDDVMKKNTQIETLNNTKQNSIDKTIKEKTGIEKYTMEKQKLKNKLNRKKRFLTISNNKMELKKKVKEQQFYTFKSINEMYKKDIENNLVNAKKRKRYIKNISVKTLFQFHYEKLANIVTSIDTNTFYTDYVTASYSSTTDIGSVQNCKGNIAIFNFMNPSYPFHLFNLNTNVLKIKYTPTNPNILTAILSNGHVHIYDIRNKDRNAIFKSTNIKNYYENSFEPIYDLSFKTNSPFSLSSFSSFRNSNSNSNSESLSNSFSKSFSNSFSNSNFTRNSTSSSFNVGRNNDVFYTVHEDGYVYEWSITKELKNKEILYLDNKKNDLYQNLDSVFKKKNFLEKSFNASLTCIDVDDYNHHDEKFIMSTVEVNGSSDKNEKTLLERKRHEKSIQHKKSEWENDDIENQTTKIEKKKNIEQDISIHNAKKEELLNHYQNVTQDIIEKKIKPTHVYYYIGTKNGIIYRCNSCYHKSYLNYYVAHFGAVNKIRINPFDHDIFLSAGDDCRIKLWNKHLPKQITTFQSKNSYTPINDIIWLPNNSTSFFACADDGRIELWDFDFFSKDPLIIFYPNNSASAKMKSLKMFHKNDILLCGDNMSNVFMMKIENLFDIDAYDSEQYKKLTNCLQHLDTYDYF